MDETLTTAGEPQVIESANTYTGDTQTAGYSQVQGTDINDGSQVIESATPMDNNITYTNVPDTTPSFDQSKDFTQNIVQRAVQSSYNSNLDANSGHAMSQFLDHDYDYDRSEAGTYWVAGAINDVDTQMSFLNTLIREEMYDEMDLQKYYYDTTMATARAYAASKERETAYGFYRAAQEKAIAEAQLTGWYMPAEGNYMLGQYTVAQNKLEDPETTDEERAKAQRISNTVEKWFSANQISTRGIKCLSMMQYEETVRHNEIMAQLQHEANQISGSSAGASAALAAIQLREFKFQVEEMELASGFNYSKDIGLDDNDYLGHDVFNDPEYAGKWEFLQGGENLQDILKNPRTFAAVLGARNVQWLEDNLGKDNYTNLYNDYLADLGNTALAESTKNNGNILDDSYLNPETYSLDSSTKEGGGKKVWTFHSTEDGKSVTRCYYQDGNGVFHQITDGSVTLHNGKKLNEIVTNFEGSKLEYNGQGINVGSKFNSAELTGSYTNNPELYPGINKKQGSTVTEKEQQGYHVVKGAFSTKKQNTNVVMSDGEKYYEVETDGTWHELTSKKDTKFITIDGTAEGTVIAQGSDGNLYFENKDKVKETDITGKEYQNSFGMKHPEMIIKNSIELANYKAGEDAADGTKLDAATGTKILMYENNDGSYAYLKVEEGNGNKVVTIISEADASRLSGYQVETPQWVKDYVPYTPKEGEVVMAPDMKSKSAMSLEKMKQDNTNYNNGYIPTVKGKNQDTMAQEEIEEAKTKASKSTPKKTSSSGGGSSSKASVKENKSEAAEKREAIFEKYHIDPIDRREYIDILDPEQLEKKIQSRYDNVLAMGGAK